MSIKPNHVLAMLLGGALVQGCLEARPAAPDAGGAGLSLLSLLSLLVFSFLWFYWYRLDSDARAYRRSGWLNAGIVWLTLIALPYYLVRSRPKGRKGRALLRLCGFALLSLVATFAGAFAGALYYGLS